MNIRRKNYVETCVLTMMGVSTMQKVSVIYLLTDFATKQHAVFWDMTFCSSVDGY